MHWKAERIYTEKFAGTEKTVMKCFATIIFFWLFGLTIWDLIWREKKDETTIVMAGLVCFLAAVSFVVVFGRKCIRVYVSYAEPVSRWIMSLAAISTFPCFLLIDNLVREQWGKASTAAILTIAYAAFPIVTSFISDYLFSQSFSRHFARNLRLHDQKIKTIEQGKIPDFEVPSFSFARLNVIPGLAAGSLVILMLYTIAFYTDWQTSGIPMWSLPIILVAGAALFSSVGFALYECGKMDDKTSKLGSTGLKQD
ncbi:hypothetical protein [Bifidobacterium lemurum]|nr:hypothetical protein [Bifidobacterium lemurum]QOL33919.1 hypothetical protein BL8807_09165 [Bifidobacterium lemurum]